MPNPRISLDNAKPLTLQQARQRHANIASAYFGSTPTINNLYNGSINWLKSKGILTPEGTGVSTGAAPTPGKTIPRVSRLNKAEQAVNVYNKLVPVYRRLITEADAAIRGSNIFTGNPREINRVVESYKTRDLFMRKLLRLRRSANNAERYIAKQQYKDDVASRWIDEYKEQGW